MLGMLGAAWIALSVVAGWFFPISLSGHWLRGVALGVAVVASGLPLGFKGYRSLSLTIMVGCLAGGFAAAAFRAPEPTTNPSEYSNDWVADSDSPTLLASRGGTVRGRIGSVSFEYEPMLTFDRASPDRFLSLLAPAHPSRSIGRIEKGVVHFDDGATLQVRRAENNGGVEVFAQTPVDEDTYTHLNTHAHLIIRGLNEPRLRFSPCADESIEARFADYPTGRPARFACLLPDGQFEVYEATSGEKGPFKTLASGPLARSEPLTISIADGETDLFTWTMTHWAAQASTDLSPTAGWRIPQNAIEFQRHEPNGPTEIWVTLAATSVGRGWDTVGHRAGVYTNESSIEPIATNGE